jgi:hypothetical protein
VTNSPSLVERARTATDAASGRSLDFDELQVISTVIRRLEEVEALYKELLFAVEAKFPDETRHQTALRYLKDREAMRGLVVHPPKFADGPSRLENPSYKPFWQVVANKGLDQALS